MKTRFLALLVCIIAALACPVAAFANEASGFKAAGAELGAQEVTYRLGQEYYVEIDEGSRVDCKFELAEKSHVYAVYSVNALLDGSEFDVSVYDSDGDLVSGNSTAFTSGNAEKGYRLEFSCDLSSGSYSLRIKYSNIYFSEDLARIDGKLVISAEPVISLARTTIKSLASPVARQAKVVASPVADALVYQYQFSTDPRFKDVKTIESPSPTLTAKGLKRGTYYYSRVRPVATYADGNNVYGGWSRARSVYVKKSVNAVTISTRTASFKFKDLKKRSRSFLVLADDNINAKLKYKLVSAPAKAKKYLKLNKSTGRMTVKKGLKRGAYKVKVKVSAAATASYYGASATKTITVKVK